MRNFLFNQSRLMYAFIFCLICTGLLILGMRGVINGKYLEAFGREAVNALALDAALDFPTSTREFVDIKYWEHTNTPCIFTTNKVQVSGNSRRVDWNNWPEGFEPTCTDFYSSRTRAFDLRTSLPGNCTPVLVFENKGGPKHSFVVLAANGADKKSLATGILSLESIERLKNVGPLSNFYPQTSKFVQEIGLEDMRTILKEKADCDGFTLFKYQVKIENMKSLQEKMRKHSYFVGMK